MTQREELSMMYAVSSIELLCTQDDKTKKSRTPVWARFPIFLSPTNMIVSILRSILQSASERSERAHFSQ